MSSLDRILPFLKPIEDLLVDPSVTEVMVNDGGRHIFVERDGAIEAVADRTLEPRNLTVAIKNIARACGDEISDMQPLLDARLEDGSRVAAMFPPCAVAGPALTIRKFTRHYTLGELVQIGDQVDVVVLGIGVRPNIDLAKQAGIAIGEAGGIATDARMATNVDGIWAAGTMFHYPCTKSSSQTFSHPLQYEVRFVQHVEFPDDRMRRRVLLREKRPVAPFQKVSFPVRFTSAACAASRSGANTNMLFGKLHSGCARTARSTSSVLVSPDHPFWTTNRTENGLGSDDCLIRSPSRWAGSGSPSKAAW